jgi:hypothetical protein
VKTMPRLLEFGDDIPDQVTTLLPVALPGVSGYMQDRYNDALINILAQLCADPEAFKREAKEVRDVR